MDYTIQISFKSLINYSYTHMEMNGKQWKEGKCITKVESLQLALKNCQQ